jgi:ABC-type transport system involved in multi-copper enzyme maturation permease subunit
MIHREATPFVVAAPRNAPMIGAILRQELLLGGRRNRLHVYRWAFAGYLILLVFFYYLAYWWQFVIMPARVGAPNQDVIAWTKLSAPCIIGRWFAEWFLGRSQGLWVLLTPPVFLLMATPPFVAGAITDEKRSGTLQYLLTSDLDTRHILVGKLVGRIAQLFLLAMAGLPMLGLMSGFGGIRPTTALLAFAAMLPPLCGIASASILGSVLCRQTRDAVLGVYIVGVFVWVILRLIGVQDVLNVDYVIDPVWGQRGMVGLAEAGRRLLTISIIWFSVTTLCLAIAVARLRPTYRRELEGFRADKVRWFSVEREPVPDDAILWRERNVEGLAPTPELRRIPQWLGITLVALATTLSSLLILYSAIPQGKSAGDVLRSMLRFDVVKLQALLSGAADSFLAQGLVVLLLASLVVGVRCSGSITGEREKQTWEALLLTPLPASQIVRSKLWGVIGASYWYLLAYAAPAVTLSILAGPSAFFWTVLWLAVTVLAMYFVGAAGIWCSVRCRDSWRSLVATLLWGYVGAGVIFLLSSPVPMVAGLILSKGIFPLIDSVLNTQLASWAQSTSWAQVTDFKSFLAWSRPFWPPAGIVLALLFFLLSRLLLTWAHRTISDRERTRHWHEEPIYRRSRRALPRMRRY